VKRQQEQDVAALLPSMHHLTERQYQLFFLFHTAIAWHTPQGFGRLADEDVAQAAGALAATLETAARGVIYEHTAASMPAQRLATELTALLEQIRVQSGTVSDTEAAIVLRAIEQGARNAKPTEDGTASAYLSLMARLLQVRTARGAFKEPDTRRSPLILP
jgi:hypothetical protein